MRTVWRYWPSGNKVGLVTRSATARHLPEECLDACRLKLITVLAHLTTRRAGRFHAVERVTGSPAGEPAIEFAQFCKRNLAANRSDWTGFLIRQVSAALDRIDNGSYGYCLQCGQPLSPRRLAALPWITCCISCQDKLGEDGAK